VVHPDHALSPAWPFGQQLAITPYPNGNAALENPSLFSGRHGTDWIVAPGAPNPVVSAPNAGHLSDPDLVYLEDRRELYLYYRQAASRNFVWLKASPDGSAGRLPSW